MPSQPQMPSNEIAATYVKWICMRAVFHRGWWLVTSLYLVTEANLTPLQLIVLGTAQGLTVVVFEIPAGAIADTFSRKWSIVLSHAVMGLGMISTGLVTSFPALMLTQMIWGLSWTFSSGADVAWLSDELDEPSRTATTLTRAARWQLIGAAFGLVCLGSLAWFTELSTSIVLAGIGIWVLGFFVALQFREQYFTPQPGNRMHSTLTTLRNGLHISRDDRAILLILGATFLINGADEVFLRLYPKRLVELGLPKIAEPIVWLTLLGLLTLLTGAIVLRIVEARMANQRAPGFYYLLGCIVASLGIALFAVAPGFPIAMLGVVLVHGVAWSVLGVMGAIWINSRTSSDVRATVQSFMSQAENMGELSLGFALGVLAQFAGIDAAMMGASLLVAAAGVLVWRYR